MLVLDGASSFIRSLGGASRGIVSRSEAGPSCSLRRPTRANKADGYLLGPYRIATAPEPNSSRLTPASHLRQRQREPHACHEQSLTRRPLELLNGLPEIPAHELRVPIDPVQGARVNSRIVVPRECRRDSCLVAR
jgi:hypothetical protein